MLKKCDKKQEPEIEYEVEKIVNHRNNNLNTTSLEYCIKWVNWSKDHNSWDTEETLNNCQECIENYWKIRHNNNVKSLGLDIKDIPYYNRKECFPDLTKMSTKSLIKYCEYYKLRNCIILISCS